MPDKDTNIDPIEWGRLLSKIDNMHEDIKDLIITVRKQNGRVRKLEVWRGYILGIACGSAALISYIIKKIL